MSDNKRLRPGDVVRVRSAREILATLDDDGTVDGIPFMPEMLPYIDRRYSVSKRVEKICWFSAESSARPHRRPIQAGYSRPERNADRHCVRQPDLLGRRVHVMGQPGCQSVGHSWAGIRLVHDDGQPRAAGRQIRRQRNVPAESHDHVGVRPDQHVSGHPDGIVHPTGHAQ